MFESSTGNNYSTPTNFPTADGIAGAFSQMPYDEQVKQFNAMEKNLMNILGVERDTPFYRSLSHYLRNGFNYLPIEGMGEEDISETKNNYLLLQDIVTRSVLFSPDQKAIFLTKIQEFHDDPTVVDGNFTDKHNHITIMHQIMEDILSSKE